jgi:hypothetical protein
MLRTKLGLEYIRRTIRPLYAFEHATPKDVLLDPNWNKSVDIYPGMCLMHAATASSGVGDVVTLLDATGTPAGLAGQYVAPTYGIDELADAGVNSLAMWVLTPGSEFEVLAPAFDSAATWTFPTNGTALLVHAYTGASGSARGKLCPAGATGASTKPVARAISRPATDRLIIAGLDQHIVYG